MSRKTRFHKITVYIVCLLNALFAPVLFTIEFTSPSFAYLVCLVVLVSEFMVLFKGSVAGKLGVALGSLLHLFVLRAIAVSTFSLVSGVSMYEVHSNPAIFPWVNFSSFASQIVTLTLFITLIPLKTVKRIMEDKRFYKNLLILTSLLVVYLSYNSYMFLHDTFSVNIAVQELVIAALVLSFFYIMILLLIQIFNLDIYKEKNKELKIIIDQERSLTSTIINTASIIIEINCTTDIIERLIIDTLERPVEHLPTLTNFMEGLSHPYTHPDDEDRMKSVNSKELMDHFSKGETELEYEYRSKHIIASSTPTGVEADSGDYLWYRMHVTIRLRDETNEIMAILRIEEIQDEKEEVLALRHRAESDQLTGAYNKNAFATQVNAFLESGEQGTLFMFDIDNFKGINDNMGHSKGDAVLREVYAEISSLFRSQDIVGRIGGDEFVVFLVGSVDEMIIKEKAQIICSLIKRTYVAENGVSIEISCSIGISIAPKDGVDFKTLFDAADIAMYDSKSRGKDTFTLYDKSLLDGFKPQEREAYMRLRSI